MRTKTLLLTVAIGAAGVAASSAQVYSVNAVGYVNLSIKAGFNMVANPLNGSPDNNLNNILPLGAAGDNTIIYRFNPATQNYYDAITYFFPDGWFATDPALLVLNPGEGFFLQAQQAFNVTFVGEVPQGNNLSYPVKGGNSFQILGSMVPQALALGSSAQANTLQFPAVDNDNVYIFDSNTQAYKDTYTYFADDGGWFSANLDDTGLAGPVVPVGTSFFVLKAGPAVQAWTRSFTVN